MPAFPNRAEERRRAEEGRRNREAEAERQKAEAKRRAQDEEARKRAETEAQKRAEKEAQQAEAKRRAQDEEGRRRAEEERSRQESEARRKAEQERAFAAAKRADDLGAVDAFLANHPDSCHMAEARTLRDALFARGEACKTAMASDDAAVLRAFLKDYPNGVQAEQVRGRLRSLKSRSKFTRFKVISAVSILIPLAGALLAEYRTEHDRAEQARITAAIRDGSCGTSVSLASLAARPASPLSTAEECALKAKDSFKECANCPEMVVIPAGTFRMGSPENEPGHEIKITDETQVQVTIRYSLAVGKFAVTRSQFEAFAKATAYKVPAGCRIVDQYEDVKGRSFRNPGFPQSDK